MNKQTEALNMAIERLQISNELLITGETTVKNKQAIQACKEALEQETQEPVAWTDLEGNFSSVGTAFFHPFPLYTHPAPSWQGLSDDEIEDIWGEPIEVMYSGHYDGIRAVEQALKERNGR